MLTIGVLYSLVYRSVLRRRSLRLQEPSHMMLTSSNNKNNTPACETNDEAADDVQEEGGYSAERMRRSNVKTAATLFVVTLVFLLTYLPALVMSLMQRVHRILFYFYFANHAANPLIYGVMNRSFRRMAFRPT